MHSCHHLTLAKENPVAQIPETRKRKPGKTQKEIRKISAPAPCPAAPPAPGYTPVLSLCPAEAGLAEKVPAAAKPQRRSAAPDTQGAAGGTGRPAHAPGTSPGARRRCSPACGGRRGAGGRRGVRGAGPGPGRERRRSARSPRRTAPAAVPRARRTPAPPGPEPGPTAAPAPWRPRRRMQGRQAGGRGAGGRAVPSARPAKMPRCARRWLRVGRREAHRPQARRRAAARALPVALRKGRAAERGRAASAPDGPAPNGRCGGLSPDSAVGAEQYMLARTAAGSRCAWGAAVPWELHGRAAAFDWYPSWKIYYFVEFQLRR